MTIPWLIGLPLAMSLLTLVLRRVRLVTTPLTAATFFALAIVLATARAEPLIVLGRSLELAPAEAMLMALNAALLGWGTLASHRIDQSRAAYSLALSAFAFSVAAVVMENLTLAILCLQIAAVLATLLLPIHRAEAAWTALHMLFIVALAGALLLVGAWAIQRQAIEPGNVQLLHLGSVTLALGFAIVIAAVPFHVWSPPVLACGSILASILSSVSLHSIGLLRFQQLLNAELWPEEGAFLASLLLISGVLGVAVGSIGAWAQRSLAHILGYAALAEAGLIFIALSLRTEEAMAAAFLHIIYRGLTIAAVSITSGALHHALGGDSVDDLVGALRRAPLSFMALALGGLGLADLPPTGGFLSRFAILRLVAAENPLLAIGLQLAIIGPAWGVIRCLVSAFRPLIAPVPRRRSLAPEILALLLALGLIALGLYPQALYRLPVAWEEVVASFGG